jgi:hypothetical protein
LCDGHQLILVRHDRFASSTLQFARSNLQI